MISGGNESPHKGMQITENDTYVDKYKTFFLF